MRFFSWVFCGENPHHKPASISLSWWLSTRLSLLQLHPWFSWRHWDLTAITELTQQHLTEQRHPLTSQLQLHSPSSHWAAHKHLPGWLHTSLAGVSVLRAGSNFLSPCSRAAASKWHLPLPGLSITTKQTPGTPPGLQEAGFGKRDKPWELPLCCSTVSHQCKPYPGSFSTPTPEFCHADLKLGTTKSQRCGHWSEPEEIRWLKAFSIPQAAPFSQPQWSNPPQRPQESFANDCGGFATVTTTVSKPPTALNPLIAWPLQGPAVKSSEAVMRTTGLMSSKKTKGAYLHIIRTRWSIENIIQ